jgi:hypothetical protein
VTSLANRGSGQLPPQSPQSYTIALGGVTWRVYLNGDRVTFLVSTDAAAAESAAMTVERP